MKLNDVARSAMQQRRLVVLDTTICARFEPLRCVSEAN
jgi:hypothetical protein